MNTAYWTRKAHRYLGLFIGIQILLWCVSGLYFVFNDINKVRGSHLRESPRVDINPAAGSLADLNAVLAAYRQQAAGPVRVTAVQLRSLLGKPVYEINYVNSGQEAWQLVDAVSGVLMPGIDEDTAIALALADFSEEAAVSSVALIDRGDGHAEFRGRDLPVYRVSMDHPSRTNIYVSAQRGVVTARRNETWRIFDFLWMLHTMDYETRDDFNNTLVKIFSILGLVTVCSGFILWALTSSVFRHKASDEHSLS